MQKLVIRFCSIASAIATTMTNCPLCITVFAPRYAVTAGSGRVQPVQSWEMHRAAVMDVAGINAQVKTPPKAEAAAPT
jgi:hypothetical protein